MADTHDALRTRAIAKRYGPVVALRSVDLAVRPGEIHALLGANGAGKSTLVKVLTGVLAPDSGQIEVAGCTVAFRSPADARSHGVTPVFQDPALLPDLTVAENLRLTGTSAAAVRDRLREMDLAPPDFGALAGELPLPLLRMLDLARALAHRPTLLVLDEITAALPSDYAERVFAVMRRTREAGGSVLFITHRLLEVQDICDRATVLRDGNDVDTHVVAEGGEERIVAAMLGDKAVEAVPAAAGSAAAQPAGETLLEVTGLGDGGRLKDVSFTLRAGEVLGVVALEGQGQEELFELLAGDRRAAAGEVAVRGHRLTGRHPREAVRHGVVLVPSDRQEALLPQRSIRENLALPLHARRWGPIPLDDERRKVDAAIERLEIDTRAQEEVRRLSGGNQQKVTIGRWVVAGFDVLLCFDLTRGIDVGTKHQIYALLRSIAGDGRGVLMFTSELREVPLVCDRTLVLYGGRVTGEMPAADADEATLLNAAHGLAHTEEAG
ncbi:sugar ABC transporter ATP-binding protein [Nonomuraea sp. M3C6]|uniref:Sugar ABC transporter ATP-binding protein n=1 Tax=Nonomuraea marmarensis TaxID=3351344 RepID=A0ABW7AQW2_9ACTN